MPANGRRRRDTGRASRRAVRCTEALVRPMLFVMLVGALGVQEPLDCRHAVSACRVVKSEHERRFPAIHRRHPSSVVAIARSRRTSRGSTDAPLCGGRWYCLG